MTLGDWIQLLLLIAASVGLIISIISNRAQQKAFTQQMRLQFFGEYTKRYQEIMVNLPSSISAKEFDYAKLDPAIREQTLRFMRVYFDLCSEEYDLYLGLPQKLSTVAQSVDKQLLGVEKRYDV